MTTRLNQYDLKWCVQRLPSQLRKLIKQEEITVSGGYIRSCIQNEQIRDIDLFTPTKEHAQEYADWLSKGASSRVHRTDNAMTVLGLKHTVQFITRWTYERPENVVNSFDFTICQAAFWWNHYCQRWESLCSRTFYQDLAARRLVYTDPSREEEPGGSMLRVLKYYQKGFRITMDSYAKVITRLAARVRLSAGEILEKDLDTGDFWLNPGAFCKVIKGLLREVDPNIDPDHIIHE